MDKTMTTDNRKLQRHRILLAVLALVLTFAMLPLTPFTQAHAAVGSLFTVANEDGVAIRYTVLTEDLEAGTGTVRVGGGTVSSRSIAQDTAGALVIPKTVENDGITYTLTTIFTYAFDGCRALTSVTIPDSVQSIGASAFRNCTSLTSVTIPNSVLGIASAFDGCTGLTSVTIGNSVETFAAGVFRNCSSLTSLTIPASVKTIRSSAFANCSSLVTLTFKGATAPNLVDSGQFNGVAASGTLYYPEGATGYDPAIFQAKGLPVDWEFVAVLPVGDPASGDLDGDGKTTTAEALVVARAVVSGTSGLTEAQIAAADMDGDGVLTMSDVVRALRKAVAL